jgi:hypothetical protein
MNGAGRDTLPGRDADPSSSKKKKEKGKDKVKDKDKDKATLNVSFSAQAPPRSKSSSSSLSGEVPKKDKKKSAKDKAAKANSVATDMDRDDVVRKQIDSAGDPEERERIATMLRLLSDSPTVDIVAYKTSQSSSSAAAPSLGETLAVRSPRGGSLSTESSSGRSSSGEDSSSRTVLPRSGQYVSSSSAQNSVGSGGGSVGSSKSPFVRNPFSSDSVPVRNHSHNAPLPFLSSEGGLAARNFHVNAVNSSKEMAALPSLTGNSAARLNRSTQSQDKLVDASSTPVARQPASKSQDILPSAADSRMRRTSSTPNLDGAGEAEPVIHRSEVKPLVKLLLANVRLTDTYLTSTGWTHENIEQRGASLLHLILFAKVNPTDLIKLSTTIEMMGVSRTNTASETAFRTDSPSVQVIAEFWRLAFSETLGYIDDHLAGFMMQYHVSPVELEPLRVAKIDATADPEEFCTKSASVLMRHADTVINLVLKILDHGGNADKRGTLVESMGIVYYIVSKFLPVERSVQILASLLFLRVVMPRFLTAAQQRPDSERVRVMRGAILLGRVVQCAANGNQEFQQPKLNTYIGVLHDSILRRFSELPRISVPRLSDHITIKATLQQVAVAISILRAFFERKESQVLLSELGISTADFARAGKIVL